MSGPFTASGPALGDTTSAAPDVRRIDLHMHSTASDGAFPPEDVAVHAHAAGLSVIALTDHDTVDGVAAARTAGELLGLRVLAGVELSALDGEREIHLLGLHLTEMDDMAPRLAEFRDTRVSRAAEMVRRLNQLGMPVTMEAVLENADGGAVGRPHVARALVAGGWVRDQREAFDKYLATARPAFVEKHRLTIGDAIQLVHDAGGIAVFAHPSSDGTRARIEPLVALGLDGLEVRHPSHSAEDAARIGALADHFKLVPSGGSDWHGATGGPRMIGNQKVPYEWLERQEARVADVRSAGRR